MRMAKLSIKIKAAVMALALGFSALSAAAQDFALKTNILSDALLNINVGAEVGLAPKWSLELTGDFNAWTLSEGKRWKHWKAMPEIRYWFCDRFDGHHVGAHLIGGQYNVGGIKHLHNFLGTDFSKLADYRFQGWEVGAGIMYGYDWILNKHWNIEAEIGIGWIYTRYDQYKCVGCGKKVDTDRPHNYFGPTKAALNLVYVF